MKGIALHSDYDVTPVTDLAKHIDNFSATSSRSAEQPGFRIYKLWRRSPRLRSFPLLFTPHRLCFDHLSTSALITLPCERSGTLTSRLFWPGCA